MNKMSAIYGLITTRDQRRKERFAVALTAMLKAEENPEAFPLLLSSFPLHGEKVRPQSRNQ